MSNDLPSLSSLTTYVRTWDKYVWILVVITILGSFLRLYNLSETVMFLGDQGRDAIVVSRIFTDADPVFIGPVMSVGNLYIGPLYYYFMMPFLWMSYPSPMGPVYAVAIVGSILIPLMYALGSQMIGKRAAILAVFFLAFSASAIELSRFSWNPNLMPFFGFVWFYCLYRATLGHRWYWVGVATSLAILLQLHYITFLAVGASGLVWLWRMVVYKKQGKWKELLAPTLLGVGIVLLFQLPLFLFDTRHDWLNARQFVKLLQGEDAFTSDRSGMDRVLQIISQSRERFSQLIMGITFQLKSAQATLLAYGILGGVAYFWSREQRKTVRLAVQLALLSILVSLAGLSLYKNQVYLHYLSFLLPIVFLLFGYLLDRLLQINKYLVVLVGVVLVAFAWQNLQDLSFKGGGPKLSMLAATAQAIHSHVDPGQPYSILLISQSKDLYGMNYRYFLTTNSTKKPLDPEKFGTAKKLFVVWEDKEVAEPLQLPLYELMVFDVATPSAVFDIPDGPTVLELRKD